MLKMFSTQLTGLLKRIQEKEELTFEDGARLLAQAVIGEGHIYLYAEHELEAVTLEALSSSEPLLRARKLENVEAVEHLLDADRVLLIARTTNDERAMTLAKALENKRIPFVSIATVTEEGAGTERLNDLSHVHINLHLKKGILPDDEGNRFAYPASIAALFVYYGLKFTIDEILEEY